MGQAYENQNYALNFRFQHGTNFNFVSNFVNTFR